MKRRTGSADNFVVGSTLEERLNSDEYFVPLVDQSRDNYSTNSCQNDDADNFFCPISPLRGGGGYNNNNNSRKSGDERISPIPNQPHRTMTIPANPQSPGDEQDSPQPHHHHHQQQQQQQQQFASQNNHHPQHQHRNSIDSTQSAPDSNSILPLRSSLVFTAHKRKSTFSFAVTAFCILGFCLYGNARSSLRLTVKEVDELVEFSEKLHRQLRRADHDMRLLERELTTLDALEAKREDEEIEERVLSQSSAFANPELVQEMNVLQEKLKESQSLAKKLKSQVREISKQDAIAKYGSGVIRVKMDLVFPASLYVPNQNSVRNGSGSAAPAVDTGPQTIVMEMAPLDTMPHSVYIFLEMVSAGLINGCSFIINALHVLKAAPLPYDGSSASNKAREFLDEGLESVAFREYSPEYPHKKYTVGFAADGSPSFFINTEDNSEIQVGDPCFARVVSGFDTVRRLDEVPTRNGLWFEDRVGIKQVTIL
mmetsp:Transcript_16346/g.37489  ORF Transcript_16346/g.37489 Transcript_16346/m.37489 type:complete len:482 (+) Transcript_16346:202-1647(+)